MVKFELNQAPELTEEEKAQLEQAEKMSVVYDEDCPALTEKMAAAFKEERKKNPYRGETLTLRVSSATLEKAKSFGEDYITVLERLLDEAVSKRAAI